VLALFWLAYVSAANWAQAGTAERWVLAHGLAGGALTVVAAAMLWRLRPVGSLGPAAFAVAITFLVTVAVEVGDTAVETWPIDPAAALLPALCWLILAWPTGRLGRLERRFVTLFAAVHIGSGAAAALVTPSPSGATGDASGPFTVADLTNVAEYLRSLDERVIVPVAALALVVLAWRASVRVGAAAPIVARAGSAAAIVVLVGEGLTLAPDYFGRPVTGAAGELNGLGVVVAAVDYSHVWLVPVIIVVASLLWPRQRSAGPPLVVEVASDAPGSVERELAVGLHDPALRVGYAIDGTWVDASGASVTLGGAGRAVTTVAVDGDIAVALEHDDALDDRPTVVEAAVATAALALTRERLLALARRQLREVRAVQRAIVVAQDDARTRLERDVHDGPQQRLVGLAIATRLAADAGAPDEELCVLRTEVGRVRQEVEDLVAGQFALPATAQTVPGVLRALSASSRIPVEVTGDASIPPVDPVSVMALWFIVGECLTNVTKHARATRVEVHASASAGNIVVDVVDDGVGGASRAGGSGLAGVEARAESLGGSIVLDSPAGGGTRVTVSIPNGVTP
jgi:signal transduction histidine kinase